MYGIPLKSILLTLSMPNMPYQEQVEGVDEPVLHVKLVKIEDVQPNDYNPNFVAQKELDLLYVSIKEDGVTQPIVTYWDPEKKKYIVIDGFHRYMTIKAHPDLLDRMKGYVPVVVLDKTQDERMAATIRHNRARGKHEIVGMSSIVNSLVERHTDADVGVMLGMEKQEIERLRVGSGWLALFEKVNYSKSWKKRLQIEVEKKYEDKKT